MILKTILPALWLLCSFPAHSTELHTLRIDTTPSLSLQVEVVDTQEERSRGMMHREAWHPIDGMLFLFDQPLQPIMWMKNTPLSMDMVFISSDGKVLGFHEYAKPFSLAHIMGSKNTKAVLEVPAGFVQAHGVKQGIYVQLPPTH